jgi:hypothetical protein
VAGLCARDIVGGALEQRTKCQIFAAGINAVETARIFPLASDPRETSLEDLQSSTMNPGEGRKQRAPLEH